MSGNGKMTDSEREALIELGMELVRNTCYAQGYRARLAAAMGGDPRRSIDDECGYPATEAISVDLYKGLFDRDPIANRVVSVLPKESWKVQPIVYESEDSEKETPFERAWAGLGRNLYGDSWYRGEEGNPIWSYLLRADILSGIGRYGALLLGLDDGRELADPVEERGEKKLLYLRAFDELSCQIAEIDRDKSSPRYGQPLFYSMTLGAYADTAGAGDVSALSGEKHQVHWTRVIHVADNLTVSEVYGVPRMRPVYNRLYDLQKLYGPSAEMYYKGAFYGLSFETHPQLGANFPMDTQGMKDSLEQYFNGLQRYLALRGVTAKTLAPTVVDPNPQIQAHIEAICIQLGIPKRIFMGSERGELASSQDEGAWNDQVKIRQINHVTPRIVVPFIDRLIRLGVLPQPKQYYISWPDLSAMSEREQAEVAARKTDTLIRYIAGGGDSLVSPIDFLTRYLNHSLDEAKEMLETTSRKIEEAPTAFTGEPAYGVPDLESAAEGR